MPMATHKFQLIYIMKYLFIFLISGLCFGSVQSQTTNPNYDEDLAAKLGADDYGMKSYVFVMLKTGPNESTDKVARDSCFSGHMSNIKRLVLEDKLIVAGPIGKNENSYRGIFILNVPTLEEASELLQSDPAIHTGYLAADLYPWYGSAALPLYREASDKIWRIGF